MPYINPSWVQVTPVIYEFLIIQLKEPLKGDILIHYKITDSGGKSVRSGNFTGMVIQLRMSFLQNGIYSLALNVENDEPVFFSFEKKSQNDADDMIITMY